MQRKLLGGNSRDVAFSFGVGFPHQQFKTSHTGLSSRFSNICICCVPTPQAYRTAKTENLGVIDEKLSQAHECAPDNAFETVPEARCEHDSSGQDANHPPCETPRQSLPTTRERRWLAELGINRSQARPSRSLQESFSLRSWHLCLGEKSGKRRRDSRRGSPIQTPKDPGHKYISVETGDLSPSFVVQSLDKSSGGPSSDNSSSSVSGPLISDSSQLSTRGEANDSFDNLHGNAFEKYMSENMRAPPLWRPLLTQEGLDEIMTWAYIVRVKAHKYDLGKRAVTRNRAKRRVAAAARVVCPAHACRGREYVFSVEPAALVTPFPLLLLEVEEALRDLQCWRDNLSLDEIKRPRFRKPR